MSIKSFPDYLLTYLLTPWCRVVLEKLTGLQLVKKFPAFHGTRRFITALTSVRHLSLSWAQPNPVHIPTSRILEIHPNIIHPSTPRSPQWSPSLQFPHQDPIHPSLLTHTRHIPSPSHSSRFYHPQNIGWEIQIIWFVVVFPWLQIFITRKLLYVEYKHTFF